ncbi:alpha/beta fold hydrolase [Nocardioides pocheonensis]|uniref:Alpha/beta hydrolase n=1 Tax=Nocardioides pocheonensis TaxID=661485 RepID=A0A3N0GK39_9ACTN|nr:alpha/beta hydrolase [Nocardioides pocheonensis]RNM12542.1 alpha/beta hydrolase [Nocardioides pocheonensis]
MLERDLRLDDGRTLRVRDTGGRGALAVLWQHGTPNIGTPPAPWAAASERVGLRWIGHDRPGYGGSTPRPGRDVASVAADVAAVADALGLDRFAVAGHSGGGPHALACAALLTGRVTATICISGLAPRDARGLDWYAGMGPADVASLRAAEAGRDARIAHEQAGSGPPEPAPETEPVAADRRALAGRWRWLETVTGPEAGAGLEGLVDDEVAFVSPWGFDPADIAAPTLLLHGAADPVVPSGHARWLAAHIPGADLRIRAGDGHVSVLDAAGDALGWLRER